MLNIFIKIILLSLFFINFSYSSNLQIFLNHPLKFKKPMDTCESTICISLLELINNSKFTIDFAIYGMMNQREIFDALVKAKERGVVIRGVVDKNNYYSSTEKLISTLNNIKSDYIEDSKKKEKFNYLPYCKENNSPNKFAQCIGYSIPKNTCIISIAQEEKQYNKNIMHNKFFIFDENTVWTGSTNISDSGTGGYNANISIILKDKNIVKFYKEEFEQMFLEKKFQYKKTLFKNQILETKIDGIKVQLGFSPQSRKIVKEIRNLINNAKTYIDLPMFYLTHKRLTKDLINAHLRGVKIRIIIDATSAKNVYSKHEILRIAGIPVKVENWGGKMHMKVAVIDGKYLITGSMNWTSAGESKNDENILIIHDEKKANKVHIFFNDLWDSIPNKWLKNAPDPESKDSGTSCFDGADNDFDGKIDNEDEGCINKSPKASLPPIKIVKKEEGHNLIKGIVTKSGKKLYILPNHKKYKDYKMINKEGWKWFCSDFEAIDEGYRKY